jgi:hypothetical protein
MPTTRKQLSLERLHLCVAKKSTLQKEAAQLHKTFFTGGWLQKLRMSPIAKRLIVKDKTTVII